MKPMKYRNNPYNIRYNVANQWQGQTQPVHGFCTFESLEHGVRAAFLLVYNYANLYGIKTPREIVHRWAPPEDNNDTSAYVAFVGQLLDVDQAITTTLEYVVLLYAMWQVEQGWTPTLFEFVELLTDSITPLVD